MGYCVNQGETKFKIKAKNVHKAWDAVKKLDTGNNYSWVGSGFSEADSFVECLECWSWEPELDEKGHVVGIEFTAEKLGDEQVLFKSIAPFVEHGSYINMTGEDGEAWRWVFENGEFHETAPNYEEDKPKPKYLLIRCEWNQGIIRYHVDKDGDRILESEESKEEALKYILEDAGIEVQYSTIEL